MRNVLKSKIHKATVTDSNINYEGSITVDEKLMELSNIWENEKVLVTNLENGERFETYAIKGEKDSGVICVNGAASLKAKKGDRIIIMTFRLTEKEVKPKVVRVDTNNQPI